MLILTRKPGQSLSIQPHPSFDPGAPLAQFFADGPIRVLVVEVQGSQARIGLAAHPGLCILREELVAVPAVGLMPLSARKVLTRKLHVVKQMRGYNSERLALEAGLSLTAVMAAESGVGAVYLDDVEKLARVLEVSVWDLFREPGRTAAERAVMEWLKKEIK